MTDQEKQDYWHTYHRFYKSRIKIYAPKINKALKHQVNQFIEARKAGKGDEQALMGVTSHQLLETLKPLYIDAAKVYGARTMTNIQRQKARMPIGFNRFITDFIEAFFRTELLNTVEEITGYTRELIRRVLTNAYVIGSSLDDIVKELVADGFTSKRSRLIARTETATASNAGAAASAQSTGLKYNKVWIAAQDNRTRRLPRDEHDHLHMDGVTIPAEDMFKVKSVDNPNGFELMEYPGDRKHGADAGNICNCRCTHGYTAVRVNGRLVRIT